MNDYEVKGGTSCHIFSGAETYEELLSAILDWWSGIQEDTKTMEAITFTTDDDGTITALIHWDYLTTEIKEALDRELLAPRLMPPVDLKSISGN